MSVLKVIVCDGCRVLEDDTDENTDGDEKKVLRKNKSMVRTNKNKVRFGNNPYSILNYDEDEDPALMDVLEPKTRQNDNHREPIAIASE